MLSRSGGGRHGVRLRWYGPQHGRDAPRRSDAGRGCRRPRQIEGEEGLVQPLGSPPMIPTAASDHGPSTSRCCCSGRSARRQAGWTASWLIAGGGSPRWSRSLRAGAGLEEQRLASSFACSGPRRANLCQRLQMSLVLAGEAQHEIGGAGACIGGKPLAPLRQRAPNRPPAGAAAPRPARRSNPPGMRPSAAAARSASSSIASVRYIAADSARRIAAGRAGDRLHLAHWPANSAASGALGNQPSNHLPTRSRLAGVLPPIQIGGPPGRCGIGASTPPLDRPASVPVHRLAGPQRAAQPQPLHHAPDALLERHAAGGELGADVRHVARRSRRPG